MNAAERKDFEAFCLVCDLLVAQGVVPADADFETLELAITKLEIREAAGQLRAA